jgi:hypothetical protein
MLNSSCGLQWKQSWEKLFCISFLQQLTRCKQLVIYWFPSQSIDHCKRTWLGDVKYASFDEKNIRMEVRILETLNSLWTLDFLQHIIDHLLPAVFINLHWDAWTWDSFKIQRIPNTSVTEIFKPRPMTAHHVACNCCVQMSDLLPCGGGLGKHKRRRQRQKPLWWTGLVLVQVLFLLLPVHFSNYFTCLVRSCFIMVSSVETDGRVHMYVSIQATCFMSALSTVFPESPKLSNRL